jgi:hypothetical protein
MDQIEASVLEAFSPPKASAPRKKGTKGSSGKGAKVIKRFRFTVLKDSAATCGSLVKSDGHLFCLKKATVTNPAGCLVAHQGEEVFLTEGQGILTLVGTGGPRGLHRLTLSPDQVERLGPSVIAKWKRQGAMTEEEWEEQYEAADVAPEVQVIEQEEDDAPSIDALELSFASPRFSDEESEIDLQPERMPLAVSENLRQVGIKPGSRSFINALSEKISELSSSLAETRRMFENGPAGGYNLEPRLTSVEETFGEASALVAATGNTVYESIHSIMLTSQENVEEAEQHADSLFAQTDDEMTSLMERTTEVEDANVESSGLLANLKAETTDLGGLINHMGKNVNHLLSFNQPAVSPAALTSADLTAIAKRVRALDNSRNSRDRGTAFLTGRGRQGSPEDLGPSEIEQIREELAVIQRSQEDIIKETGFVVSPFAELEALSQDEKVTWVTKHFVNTGENFDAVLDVMSFLARAYAIVGNAPPTKLKDLEQLGNHGLQTAEELQIVDSSKTLVPQFFHKGAKGEQGNLSQIPTMTAFDDKTRNQKGVKHQTLIATTKLQTLLGTEIGRIEDKDCRTLCQNLLHYNVAFVKGFIQFYDEHATSLTQRANYTDADAVMLTNTVVRQMFDNLQAKKSAANGAASIMRNSRAKGIVIILNATLDVHKTMAEYTSYNFGEHPSVSTQLVQFLLRQNSESQANPSAGKFDALYSKIDVLERTKKDAKQAQVGLTARVEKLEAKA